MFTYGIILQLIVVSLLLADSSGQSYEKHSKWKEFVSEKPADLETLYSYADNVFGSDNWSHEIKAQTVETDVDSSFVQCQSTVRISLPNGVFHDGIDYTFLYNYGPRHNVVKYKQESLNKAFYNALVSFQSARYHVKKMEEGKFYAWEEKIKAERQTLDGMWDIISSDKREAAKLEYEHFNEDLLRANQRRAEELTKERAMEDIFRAEKMIEKERMREKLANDVPWLIKHDQEELTERRAKEDIAWAEKIKEEERMREKLANDVPWLITREKEELMKKQAEEDLLWAERSERDKQLREKMERDMSRLKKSEDEKFKDQKLKEDKFRYDESKKDNATKDTLIKVKSIDNNLKTEKSVDEKIKEKKFYDSILKKRNVKDDPSKPDKKKSN